MKAFKVASVYVYLCSHNGSYAVFYTLLHTHILLP